jgi:hypothetical protein
VKRPASGGHPFCTDLRVVVTHSVLTYFSAYKRRNLYYRNLTCFRKLNPRIIVLREKLIVPQLLGEFLVCCGTSKVYHRVHNSPTLVFGLNSLSLQTPV